MPSEIVVPASAPMPRGYTFVRKGNVYVTANCRRATHAAGKPLFVVMSNASASAAPLGLWGPAAVAAAVRSAERETRSARRAATERRDAALATAFRDALRAAYPAIPPATVPLIVQHAMTKRQGRVARTSTLDLAARVRLAVRAHIRHRNTDYEALMRAGGAPPTGKAGKAGKGKAGKGKAATKEKAATTGISRLEARALTVGRVDAIEREWAGKPAKAAKAAKAAQAAQGSTVKKPQTEGNATGARDARNGKADAASKAVKIGKANKADRIQKPTATRASKSEAAARIARYSEQVQETIVVGSSDVDFDYSGDSGDSDDSSSGDVGSDSDWTQ